MPNIAKKSFSRKNIRTLQKVEDDSSCKIVENNVPKVEDCVIKGITKVKKPKLDPNTSDQNSKINEMVKEAMKKNMFALKKAILQNIPKTLSEYERQINHWKESYSNVTLIMNQKNKELQETDLLNQKLKQEISEKEIITQNLKYELKEKETISEKLFKELKDKETAIVQLKQDLEKEKNQTLITLNALKATLNKPSSVNNYAAQSTKPLSISPSFDNSRRPNNSSYKISNKTIAIIRSNKSPNGFKPASLNSSINDAVIDLTDDPPAQPQHNNASNNMKFQPDLPLVTPPDQPVKLKLTSFLNRKILRLFWVCEKMTRETSCVKSYELWVLTSKERCWRQLLEVQAPALPASCDVSHHSTASYCILPIYHSLHKGPFSNIVVVKSTRLPHPGEPNQPMLEL